MHEGDMPEIEMNVSPEDLGEVDLTPVMLRRFAWDIMPCPEVPDLLTALGLTHGTPEGMDMDHRDSHQRLAPVFPLEPYLQRFAEVLGVVTSTAMTQKAGVDLGEDSVKFAEQEANTILAGARAIIAQFIESGVLTYGMQVYVMTGEAEGE